MNRTFTNVEFRALTNSEPCRFATGGAGPGSRVVQIGEWGIPAVEVLTEPIYSTMVLSPSGTLTVPTHVTILIKKVVDLHCQAYATWLTFEWNILKEERTTLTSFEQPDLFAFYSMIMKLAKPCRTSSKNILITVTPRDEARCTYSRLLFVLPVRFVGVGRFQISSSRNSGNDLFPGYERKKTNTWSFLYAFFGTICHSNYSLRMHTETIDPNEKKSVSDSMVGAFPSWLVQSSHRCCSMASEE